MKNLLAIAIVMLFAAYFAQSQTNNCTASATGTFSFTVEQAIGLTGGDQKIDLGAVCPGCTKRFQEQCANWTVTGGKTCLFEAKMTGYTPIQGITVSDGWLVNTNGTWVAPASPYQYPIWANNQNVMFKVCVNSIGADCIIEAGQYSLTYKLQVDYICSLTGGQIN